MSTLNEIRKLKKLYHDEHEKYNIQILEFETELNETEIEFSASVLISSDKAIIYNHKDKVIYFEYKKSIYPLLKCCVEYKKEAIANFDKLIKQIENRYKGALNDVISTSTKQSNAEKTKTESIGNSIKPDAELQESVRQRTPKTRKRRKVAKGSPNRAKKDAEATGL